MEITLEQLRRAVKSCTPGAPDSYADRLWAELANEPRPRLPGGFRAHTQAGLHDGPCWCGDRHEYR